MMCRVIDIDLAKSVFQAYGVNQHLALIFNQTLTQRDFYSFMAQQLGYDYSETESPEPLN